MEIDTTTLVLELVNFVVLVWLLNRFLFRPVMAVMDERREKIALEGTRAQQLKAEAEALRVQYENRLEDWAREKKTLQDALKQEMDKAREAAIEEAREAARKEAEKIRMAAERKQKVWQREVERRALQQAAAFAARLLTRLSGAELDALLLEVFITDIADGSEERRQKLRKAIREAEGRITVVTARALPASLKKKLEKALSETFDMRCQATYEIDEEIVSGLRVQVGPWLLQADIGSELAFFADSAEDKARVPGAEAA